MTFVTKFCGSPGTDISHLCPSKFLLKETGKTASDQMKKMIRKMGGVLADQGRLRFDQKQYTFAITNLIFNSIQTDHWAGTSHTRRKKLDFHGVLLTVTKRGGNLTCYLIRFSNANRKDKDTVILEILQTLEVNFHKKIEIIIGQFGIINRNFG